MGCTKSKVVVAKPRTHSDDVTSADYASERRKALDAEIELRIAEEKALSEKLYAEKEGLRIRSNFMIQQTSSCDNLLDLLEKQDLDRIRQDEEGLRVQKSAKLRVEAVNKDKLKRSWIIYNNFGAIPREDMELLADFFEKILALASIAAAHDSVIDMNSSQVMAALQSTKQPQFMSAEVIKNRKSLLLALNISTLVTEQSFNISDVNVHCYDLPSGLVTAGVAKAVFDLYNVRGRLSETAVHKLLKLGYKSLKEQPNISQVAVGPEDRLTVVGDLHGQLQDVLFIIESSGMPSKTNKYLFNGDFVDRGQHGAEVVCLLLALHLAFPDSVFMNRGNHEDYAICVNYGFQMECIEKYDELTFGMFIEVFQQLPLFAIINSGVIVIHGGLFHCKNATLAELNNIQRTDFTLQDLPEEGEGLEALDRKQKGDFLKQLQRDALWSDPIDSHGNHLSARGAGVGFGPDVTRAFLELNNLKMVVRSHECVQSGYQEPYAGDDSKGILCTIFSASDYGAGGNTAAYMVFKNYDKSDEETMAALRATTQVLIVGLGKSTSELAAERVLAHLSALSLSSRGAMIPASSKSNSSSSSSPSSPVASEKVAAQPQQQQLSGDDECATTRDTLEVGSFLPANSGKPEGDHASDKLEVSNNNSENPSDTEDHFTSNADDDHHDADNGNGVNDEEGPPQLPELRLIQGTNLGFTVSYFYMNATDDGGMKYENLLAPRAPMATAAEEGKGATGSSLTRSDSTDTLVPDGVLYPKEEHRADMNGKTTEEDAAAGNTGSTVDAVLVKVVKDAAPEALSLEEDQKHTTVLFGATMTLFELIVRSKVALYEAFESFDEQNTGGVTSEQWAAVMSQTLQLHLRWHAIIHLLVDESHYQTSNAHDEAAAKIDYALFIESFTPDVCVLPTSLVIASRSASFNYGQYKTDAASRENSFTATDLGLSHEALQRMLHENEINAKSNVKTVNPNSISLALAEAMAAETTVTFNEYSIPECVANILYSENFAKIVAGFRSIDTDNDGVISKEEFVAGCAAWNAKILAAKNQQIAESDVVVVREDDEDVAAVYLSETIVTDYSASATMLTNGSNVSSSTSSTSGGFSSSVAASGPFHESGRAANMKIIDQMDRLMMIMDVNEAGKININEFFEMFRLSLKYSLADYNGDEEAYWKQFDVVKGLMDTSMDAIDSLPAMKGGNSRQNMSVSTARIRARTNSNSDLVVQSGGGGNRDRRESMHRMNSMMGRGSMSGGGYNEVLDIHGLMIKVDKELRGPGPSSPPSGSSSNQLSPPHLKDKERRDRENHNASINHINVNNNNSNNSSKQLSKGRNTSFHHGSMHHFAAEDPHNNATVEEVDVGDVQVVVVTSDTTTAPTNTTTTTAIA